MLLIRRVVFHLGILDTDSRIRRNRTCDKRIASDNGVLSYDGLTAQDRSTCVDDNIILDRRMTLLSGKLLSSACRERTDGYTLIDLYIISDYRCLADNYSGSVIDKEISSDSSTRMDIDSCS